jgi:hypothetical protein
MARLKLSPSGLRSPLDLSVVPAPADVAPADEAAPRAARLTAAPTAGIDASGAETAPRSPATPDAENAAPTTLASDAESAAQATGVPAPESEAAAATSTPPTSEAATPVPAAPTLDGAAAEAATPAVDAAPSEVAAPSGSDDASANGSASAAPASDLPTWAAGLERVSLAPDRLLGRPKQTALILDRELSSRADALVAATGPRVTFAALVTAILHFHLPTDGEAAARAIGGYRRRKLETLDRPWEERNARLPEPLRAELDDVVAGATGRVASVRRSTLVNALLDAHLPAGADDASRLVVRMEMVRGGAFLDTLA